MSDPAEGPTSAPSQPTVGGRVALGALLFSGARALQRALGLFSIALLARLLSPEDFGVIALAMVILGFLDIVSNLQVSAALVRKSEISDEAFDAAFALGVTRGVLMAAAMLLGAAPLAAAFDAPALAPALMAMALFPFIDGLRSPRFVLFEKRLDFTREATVIVCSKFGGMATAVGVALVTGDHWALVFGAGFERFVACLLSWRFAPCRPGWSTRDWGGFLKFGGWLAGAQLLAFANYKSDTVFVGAVLGTSATGQYSMGDQLSSIATNEVRASVGRALYPGLATMGGDPSRLRNAYRMAQAALCAIILPIGVGVSLVAYQLVFVLLGPQWTLSAQVVQVVAPVAAAGAVVAAVEALAMVDGQTRVLFMRNLLGLALRVPSMALGYWLYGLPGLLGARVLSSLVLTAATLRIAGTILRDSPWTPVRDTWRTLAACAAMAAAVLALDTGVATSDPADWTGNLAALTLKSALGASVYIGVHTGLWIIAGRPDGAERRLGSVAARAVSKVGSAARRRLG